MKYDILMYVCLLVYELLRLIEKKSSFLAKHPCYAV